MRPSEYPPAAAAAPPSPSRQSLEVEFGSAGRRPIWHHFSCFHVGTSFRAESAHSLRRNTAEKSTPWPTRDEFSKNIATTKFFFHHGTPNMPQQHSPDEGRLPQCTASATSGCATPDNTRVSTPYHIHPGRIPRMHGYRGDGARSNDNCPEDIHGSDEGTHEGVKGIENGCLGRRSKTDIAAKESWPILCRFPIVHILTWSNKRWRWTPLGE